MAEQEMGPQSTALIALIDRLEELLERSELSEIEIEAGTTGLVLRTPAALALLAPAAGAADTKAVNAGTQPAADEGDGANARIRAVLAPLTGVYYGSPSPGAEPYVLEGTNVLAGQVIGLIEAMKLFNEIKSDVAGRVARICVESGALVKAKQPLIELEP